MSGAARLLRRIGHFAALARRRANEQRLARARRMLSERGIREHGRDSDLTLLLQVLSASQRAEFARTSSFTVRGSSGHSYRICYGTIANIRVLKSERVVEHRLCAGPPGLSAPAMKLAQKLMLETSEREFLRVAIRHSAIGGLPTSPFLGL